MLKIRQIAILTGITLALLELTLQAGALLVWLTHSPTSASKLVETDKTVLCVGDSFTYGMGSSGVEHSYPAQLEKILTEDLGDSWQVISDGWPSRNSREALERIPLLLETSRPNFVCIIIGINDFWSRPARLEHGGKAGSKETGGSGDSFRIQWRTGRLISWLMGESIPTGAEIANPTRTTASAPESPQATTTPTPLAGTAWKKDDSVVVFLAGGQAFFSAVSDQPCSWIIDDEILLVKSPDTTARYKWQQEGNTLSLLPQGSDEAIVLTATAMPKIEAPLTATTGLSGWELLENGDLEKAEQAFRAKIAQSTNGDPSDREGLIHVLAPRGEIKEAMEHLRWLEAAHARDSTNREVASALVSSLNLLGFGKKCMDVALVSLEQSPDNPYLWFHAAWQLFQHGHEDRAKQAIKKCLESIQDSNSPLLVWACQNAAHIYSKTQPRKSLYYAVRFFLLGGDRKESSQLLSLGENYTEEMLMDVLDELGLPSNERQEIESVYHQAKFPADDDEILSTYEAHLRQMIHLCRERGATAVLVSYPWADERLTRIHHRLDAEMQIGVLDLATQFDQRLIGKTRADYFAADGHCNDAGYKIMAQIVADDLKSRMK